VPITAHQLAPQFTSVTNGILLVQQLDFCSLATAVIFLCKAHILVVSHYVIWY